MWVRKKVLTPWVRSPKMQDIPTEEINMKNLIEQIKVVNREIEVSEEVLNDGLDYTPEFRQEVEEYIDEQVQLGNKLKEELRAKYNVFAV